MLAATGCIHPTCGEFNNNTSLIPPLGKFTGHNNLPPAAMLQHPGPGVDGPGPGVMMSSASMMGGSATADARVDAAERERASAHASVIADVVWSDSVGVRGARLA